MLRYLYYRPINTKKNVSMKKIISYLRENSPQLLFFALLVAIIICLLSTARLSKRVTDLEYQYVSLEHNWAVILDNIEDKVDFLSNWAMEAPSVTLGDTYINQSDNSRSIVNKKEKGSNNAK